MRSISRQDALLKPSLTQQQSEAAKAANQTEIVSPANEQYENRSKLLRYHYKQEPMRKQRSGIQAEYKRQHRIQRKQRSGEAEYKWPMLQQVLQPAAYLARELRRIVCWLLILSAEI